MTTRVIVNVGHSFWYPAGQDRLAESLLEQGEGAARLLWRDHWPPGCPPHDLVPYAFKVYALLAARDAGADQALWIDSSCWAIRPLDVVWAQLDDLGHYLEVDGHPVGEWISDDALAELGVTRDEVWTLPLPEGKLMGFDFRHPDVRAFLDELVSHLDAFRGPWTNDHGQASTDPRCRGHRHDIAVTGVLAPRHSFLMTVPKRVAFPVDGVEPADTAVFLSQGMATW